MSALDFPTIDSAAAAAPETGLDPASWDEMRGLGHRMVDDMMDYLRGVRERPAWTPIPQEAKDALSAPLPVEPQGAEAAYADFARHVLPYPTGNIHPRFWGWVMGTGTPLGMLADMLAGAMNSNAWGGEQSAAYVEAQVLEWFRQAMDFPEGSSGLLVSGGSMANLVGLTVARNAIRDADVIRGGVRALKGEPVIYASDQTHSSVDKSAIMLGLGTDALRKVRTDAGYRIDLDALEAAIDDDLAAGRRPFAVVANAGTVGTGAIDPFHELADLAVRRGLWVHVDGAIAGPAVLSPRLKALLAGMERADSVGFDLHKWLYVPYEVGAVLVRDPATHRRSFSPAAGYLRIGIGGSE
jgi:aromatic-L-amino-acid decarboxylase